MKRSNALVKLLLEIIQILMVYLGVLCALNLTTTSLDIVYDKRMFMIFLAIGSVLFYALFSVLETFKRGKLIGIGGLLVFYIALAIRFYGEIYQGTVTLINSFLKSFMNYTGTTMELLSYLDDADISVSFSTTLVLILLGVFLVAVVSGFFYRKRRASVFIICTLPFVIIPLFVGRLGNYIDLFTYLVILVTVIGTRQLRTNSTDRRLRQKLSVILIIIGIISGVISYIVIPPARYERNKDRLLEAKNTASALAKWEPDEVISWVRSYLSGDEMDYGVIGDKASINHTGRVLLKLSGELNSDYGLYMKSYVGDIYENNKWSSIKQDKEYKQDISMLGSLNITPDSYHVQLRNDIGDNEKSGIDNLWKSGTLRVRNLTFGFGNYVIPVLSTQSYITQDNGRLKSKTPGIDYTEEYYTVYPYAVRRMLMNSAEDLVDPVFWTTNTDKSDIIKAFAQKYYLQVPDDLKNICDDYKSTYKTVIEKYQDGEGDISDVLRTVRQYISAETSYTETPGRTPRGKDSVEYFLKESKKGYCTYYASAAAILLRSVGIPTRYVEGIYVSAEDIKKAIPEELEVKDYAEHAWVEVFDERYGFVTFETTPGRGEQLDEEIAKNSGYNGDSATDGVGPSITPTPIPSEVPEEDMIFDDIEGNEEPDSEQPEGSSLVDDKSSNAIKIILIIIISLVVIVFVAEGQRRIRKALFRKGLTGVRDRRRRVRVTHRHLTPYLTKRGISYTGQTVSEFKDQMRQTLQIPEQTAALYVDTVFRAAFGPGDITETEAFKFRETYEEICKYAYAEARPMKKLYYMYVLVL